MRREETEGNPARLVRSWRGPRYREPLDCDQALGDVIEQIARGGKKYAGVSMNIPERTL